MSTNDIEEFFVKDGKIFSSNEKTLILPSPITISTIDEQTQLLEKNRFIIEEIDNILEKNFKIVNITGEIPKTTIEKLKKIKSKKYFIKPSDEKHYDFLEKTSQIDIIDQFSSLTKKEILLDAEKIIKDYIERNELKEKEYIEQLQNSIQNLHIEIEKKEKERNDYETQELNPLREEILKKKKEIKELETKLNALHNLKFYEEKYSILQENISRIEKKKKYLLFEIEKIEYDVKILKAKISTLIDKKKLGQKKAFRPILTLATLGTIYWTSYSNISHYVKKLHSNINKKKEKILEKEKILHKTKFAYEELKEKEKKLLLEIKQVEEKAEEKEIQIKEKIASKNNKIEEINEKLTKKQEKDNNIFSEISQFSRKLEELQTLEKKYLKYSTKEIKNKFKILEQKVDSNLENINKTKKQLNSQKFPKKGEWILKIEKNLLENNN